MPPSRDAWADAFHRQARSNLLVYRLLQSSKDIPPCHALHSLQMTCEKIAKAHRLRDTEGDVETLTASHGGFEVLVLAREIERLAPAIDRETTPANTEYPGRMVIVPLVPCEYAFPSVSLLTDSAGWSFLKFIAMAIDAF